MKQRGYRIARVYEMENENENVRSRKSGHLRDLVEFLFVSRIII